MATTFQDLACVALDFRDDADKDGAKPLIWRHVNLTFDGPWVILENSRGTNFIQAIPADYLDGVTASRDVIFDGNPIDGDEPAGEAE